MHTLILLRHGQSTYNADKRFCGWTDAPLTEQGTTEAIHAGTLLAQHGYTPTIAHTSYLSRAIKTLWLTLEAMDRMWIPVHNAWQLNERHYGDLQGKQHTDMIAAVGEEQVHTWRRSYSTQPPMLTVEDSRHPSHDPRYALLDPAVLPAGESLADTVQRFMPYWESTLRPQILAGETLIISAHGNSIRAILKHLLRLSDEEIVGYEIPTGHPLILTLDEQLQAQEHHYL